MAEGFNFKFDWNNFEKTCANKFSSLRHNTSLADITLVGNDLEKIRAHKVVLSSGSPFFSNLVEAMPTHNPFLYLNNVPSKIINLALDFLYKGQAVVCQEDMKFFFNFAKMLMQLDGLTYGGEPRNEGSVEAQEIPLDYRKIAAEKYIIYKL